MESITSTEDSFGELVNLVGVPGWAQDGEFRYALTKLTDSQANFTDEDLLLLLRSFSDNVNLFTVEMTEQLLRTFLDWKCWVSRSPTCIDHIRTVWVKLSVKFPILLPVIFEALDRLFYGKDFFIAKLRFPVTDCWHHFTELFLHVSTLLPQGSGILLEQLLKHLPSWRRSTPEVLVAVGNLLHFLTDEHFVQRFDMSQKCDALRHICTLMVDVELNPDGCRPLKIYNEQAEITSLLQSTSPGDLRSALVQLSEVCRTQSDNWTKLELLVWLVVVHLRDLAKDKGRKGNTVGWSQLCAIFRTLRDIFAQHILPLDVSNNSHLAHAIPLVCLYTCSLKPGIVINFADFLWTWVKDEAHDAGSRMTALAYLTSVLTRLAVVGGGSCQLDLAMEMLNELTVWCIGYPYRTRHLVTGETQLLNAVGESHQLYYAICDTVFYTLVQLHAPLLDPDNKEGGYYRCSVEQLPLAHILMCPLQPLLRSPPSLRWAFNQVILAYDLFNASLGLLPSSDSGDPVQTVDVKLDTTAFDKEMLRQLPPSRSFILPFGQLEQLPFQWIIKSVVRPLVRDYVVGKRLQSHPTTNTSASKTSRKRYHPCQSNTGIDVQKLARLVDHHSSS